MSLPLLWKPSISISLFCSLCACACVLSGAAKTFFHVDGLDTDTMKALMIEREEKLKRQEGSDAFPIIGNSGKVLQTTLLKFSRVCMSSRSAFYDAIAIGLGLCLLRLTFYQK